MPQEKGTLKGRQSSAAIRRAVTEAALTVFATNGFEGASTRAIAALAGMNLGHMAYYFKTKEAIWNEVITVHALPTQEWLKNSMTALDLTDPSTAARKILPSLLRQFANNDRLTRLMLQDFSVESSRHDRVVQEVGRPVWLQLQPLFQALQDQLGGDNEDAKLAYFAMVGSALLFCGGAREVKQIAGLDSSQPTGRESFINRIVESVLRGQPIARTMRGISADTFPHSFPTARA